MKIYIEDQILEYENNKNEIDKIFNEIDNIIDKSSKLLSHMIIDDLEIYESYYDYFLDNIRVIEKVEVVVQTYKELVYDILISTIEYLGEIPKKVQELANKFYKNVEKEVWNDLNDLLGGVIWIINTFSSIDQDARLKDVVPSYEQWNLYAQEVFSLQEILNELEEALLNKDLVLIGDMLSYEILPKFEEMEEQLIQLMGRKDVLNDFN
ncbi:hypothetical protein [Tissierella praeacuta]|uniref:hypothetical protein n=1 Tax=Tissierella praeacuta TaxID=43131 RepID=UPI00333E5AC2